MAFTWTVKITVSDNWVEDGYEVIADNLKQAILSHQLGYAYEHEVQVEVVEAPDPKAVAVMQGYPETPVISEFR